jgi:ABC-2 type transport system ATP-binding protein
MTTAQLPSITADSPVSSEGAPPAIALHDVRKSFGRIRAVDGIDLTIESGQVVAFLGPNGAGKTTTIDMILGLSRPTQGHVEVFSGTPRDAVVSGRVGAVMQSGGLLKELTIAETLDMTAALFVRTAPVTEVLRRAGIEAIADRRVGKCSGGEQQRLRFAMALLPDPDLLILDEPTAGMDVEGRREFWSAVRADAQRGRTIMFATHYLEEADAYADRVVLMRKGQIVADGTAAQIKSLASGRTLRATFPGAVEAELRALPGVEAVEIRGDAVLVHGSDTDAVARHLLCHTDAEDLEISAHNLEDAFIALTSDDSDERSNS